MKKILLAALLISFLTPGFSQYSVENKYRKAVFVEALGNGLLLSANYDMRLKKGVQDGLGIRVGMGGFSFDAFDTEGLIVDVGVISLPLEVNYMVGKKRTAFEAGIGTTLVYATASVNDFTSPDNDLLTARGFGATGFLNIGFRAQPLNNGLIFRINWNPGFNSSGFYPTWFGMSLGYSFK